MSNLFMTSPFLRCVSMSHGSTARKHKQRNIFEWQLQTQRFEANNKQMWSRKKASQLSPTLSTHRTRRCKEKSVKLWLPYWLARGPWGVTYILHCWKWPPTQVLTINSSSGSQLFLYAGISWEAFWKDTPLSPIPKFGFKWSGCHFKHFVVWFWFLNWPWVSNVQPKVRTTELSCSEALSSSLHFLRLRGFPNCRMRGMVPTILQGPSNFIGLKHFN